MKNRDASSGARRRTSRYLKPAPLSRPGREPPEYLSHSSIGDYATCPALYALARLDRAPKTVSKSSTVGSVAHRVVDLVASGGSTQAAIVEAIDDQAEARSGKAPSVREVTALMDRFSDWGPTDPSRPSLVEAEKPIEGVVGDYRIRCLVDAVDLHEDGSLILSDYKTGRTPTPVDEDPVSSEPIYRADVTRQVVLYAIVARSTGLDVRRARLLYPRTQTSIEVDLESDRGAVLMTEAHRFVTYQGDRIMRSFSTGRFQPRPSPGRCGSCPVSASCPASMHPGAIEDDAA